MSTATAPRTFKDNAAVLAALMAKEITQEQAMEALDSLKTMAIAPGDIRAAVSASGMITIYFGGQFPTTMSAERILKLMSTGSSKLNADGSTTFTPKSVIGNHWLVEYIKSKPTTKHAAKEARTLRGKAIPAQPAFVAVLGEDKRKEIGLSDE